MRTVIHGAPAGGEIQRNDQQQLYRQLIVESLSQVDMVIDTIITTCATGEVGDGASRLCLSPLPSSLSHAALAQVKGLSRASGVELRRGRAPGGGGRKSQLTLRSVREFLRREDFRAASARCGAHSHGRAWLRRRAHAGRRVRHDIILDAFRSSPTFPLQSMQGCELGMYGDTVIATGLIGSVPILRGGDVSP
jgi:hypothetical protein